METHVVATSATLKLKERPALREKRRKLTGIKEDNKSVISINEINV